jgi:hypothetical protein
MTRQLEPELLDALPPGHPDAVQSRRDLRRVNWWMNHRRILLRALAENGGSSVRRIVELGAGDGTLVLRLAEALHTRWREVELTLVDRQPVISRPTLEQLSRFGWRPEVVSADALEWLGASPANADIIFVNLFLHHFDTDALRQMLALIAQRTSVFVALEPRRGSLPLAACGLLRLIGCNHVTRHDARISVRAGFQGQELSGLWPKQSGWHLKETRAGLFSHLFIARCINS